MSVLRKIFSKYKEPKVIIQYGRLIDPFFIFYCQNYPDANKFGWDKWVPPTREQIDKKIAMYKEEWGKYDMAKKICDCFGMSFGRDVIDVFIVSGIPRECSHPLIIRSGLEPKQFVVGLTHELIHRILTTNKIQRVVFDKKESGVTNNHVVVYAVLKKILDEELWNIAIRPVSTYPSKEYSRARELSEQIGPDNVIKKMTGQLG